MKVAYGTRLPNGAVCKGFKPYSEYSRDAHTVVVLAFWPERGQAERGEWVTWLCDAETGACEHGHYHECLSDALDDFYERGVSHGS